MPPQCLVVCFIRAASYGCCLLAAYPVSSPAAVFASASWAALPVGGRLEGPPELFLGRLCAAASRTLSSALPPYLPTLTTHVPMLADAIGMSRRCFGGGALEWVLDRHIVGGRTPVCGLSVVCDGLIETDNIMWLICRLWCVELWGGVLGWGCCLSFVLAGWVGYQICTLIEVRVGAMQSAHILRIRSRYPRRMSRDEG